MFQQNKNINLAILALFFIFIPYSSSLEIVRGPYLQSAGQDSIIIAFVTDEPERVEVQYGKEPPSFESVLEEDKSRRHKILINGLEPGTKYYYKILAGSKILASGNLYYFFTNKIREDEEFSFVVIGDSGSKTPAQKDILVQIAGIKPDFIIHTGDLAYPSGSLEDFDKKFFPSFKNLIRNICIWPTPGNHEYKSKNAKPYFKLFYLPANNPLKSESYYSFDYGNSHFVSLDTSLAQRERGFRRSIINWLKEDLASTDKLWKFVFFHHPPYNCGKHGSSKVVKDELVNLFEKYGVDIIFSGHDHNYQRTYPLIKGIRTDEVEENSIYENPQGPIYIISGGGGSSIYDVERDCNFLAFVKETYHFLKITINENHLTLDAINRSGKIFDTLIISKK